MKFKKKSSPQKPLGQLQPNFCGMILGWPPSKTVAAKLKIEKRGDEIKKKSSPLKRLSQSQPNFAEMILGWSPFKIVSVSAVLYPKWPKLLYFKPESAQI
jgi:hypothetical protein